MCTIAPFILYISGQGSSNYDSSDQSQCATDGSSVETVDDDEVMQIEAFIEFEDDLANGDTNNDHSITIEFNGQIMYKASALRLISTGVGLKKSADRLKRVQGLSKFNTKNTGPQLSESCDILTVKDPLATLVTSNGQDISLVVFLADTITDTVNKSKHTFVGKSQEHIEITGRPISLVLDIEQGFLTWEVGTSNKVGEIRVNMSDCATIQPKFMGGMKHYFDNEDLEAIFNGLVMKHDDDSSKRKLPRSTVSYSGHIVLTMGRAVGAVDATDNTMFECVVPGCKTRVPAKKMRLHVAKHILKNDIDVFACGFCGESGEHKISLKKTSHQTLIPHSNCPKMIKFSLAAAAKTVGRNPFSNRPVACQVCKEVYWSYAMKKHFDHSHIGHTCNIIVSEEEKQWVLSKK